MKMKDGFIKEGLVQDGNQVIYNYLLIQSLSNFSNNTIINEFSLYRKSNGSSERDQNNNLNVLIECANFLDSREAYLLELISSYGSNC